MTVSHDMPTGATARAGFGRRVFVWLALVSVIFAGVTALLFGSIAQLINSAGWVAHSYQVIDALDVTEDAFTDAQSAERGYVATCKLALISPFRSDLPRIYSEIANLRALLSDNPAQLQRAESLNTALNVELSRMSAVVGENMRGDLKGAEAMLVDDANMRATRTVFSIIDAMENEERSLLATRLHTVQHNAWFAVAACSVGVAICLAILAFVFWLTRREVRRREASEASLHDSNMKLTGSLTELQRYNDAARSIAILGELLQTCRNAGEALAIASRHLEQLLPGASGTIATFSNSRDMLEVAQRVGADAGFAGNFAPEECWALRRGRAHSHAPHGGEPCCAHLGAADAPTICLPMSAQSETLGVLSLRTDRRQGFAGLDRQSIQTIAEQLSLALSNIKLQQTLRNQSFRDPLTGLFNRRYLDEALQREIARAQRHGRTVSIAMLDIDHFKRFNDTHGHEGGDVLLAAFAQLLGEQARAEDIVCRYGGEEFAIILPGAALADAKERIDALRLGVKALHVQLQGQPLGPVTMSAGVAVFPAHGATGMAVLHVADAALYQAKTEGRDRVVEAVTPAALLALGRPAKKG